MSGGGKGQEGPSWGVTVQADQRGANCQLVLAISREMTSGFPRSRRRRKKTTGSPWSGVPAPAVLRGQGAELPKPFQATWKWGEGLRSCAHTHMHTHVHAYRDTYTCVCALKTVCSEGKALLQATTATTTITFPDSSMGIWIP